MNTVLSILIIVTSWAEIDSSEKTGLWLEEFAIPYMEFKKSDFNVEVVSIKGGVAPIDPRSKVSSDEAKKWSDAINALKNTTKLSNIEHNKYSAVYIPGGHGTMFDLPNDKNLHKILRDFAENNKIISSICHGPASLVGVTLSSGEPLVKGKTITSFTNNEEKEAGFIDKMPFLLESKLKSLGANFIVKPNWSNHIEVDGNIITGQNPQSSLNIAQAIINRLKNRE